MKKKLGTPKDMEGVGETTNLRFTIKVTYAPGPFEKKNWISLQKLSMTASMRAYKSLFEILDWFKKQKKHSLKKMKKVNILL